MALPKIKTPTFEVKVPSNKREVKVRQFTVKEEKILLIARQSGEPADFFRAITQIVNNCMIDKLDVSKLPLFDVEYLFTKIRAVSISNISKVSFKDNEDGKVYDFSINLDQLEVKFPEGEISNTFTISPVMKFTLRYPPIEIYKDKEFFNMKDDEIFDKIVVSCLDKIYEGEKIYDASENKPEEIREFIDSLPAKIYEDMRKFLSNLPSMSHEISYKNENGKEVKITLRTIEDFFTFG